MESAARVLLGAFAAIVLVHYMTGGVAHAKAYLRYAFTGTGTIDQTTPTGRTAPGRDRNGKPTRWPTQIHRDPQPDGSIIESEIAIP